jgi:DnaJ-class molecular chaperone
VGRVAETTTACVVWLAIVLATMVCIGCASPKEKAQEGEAAHGQESALHDAETSRTPAPARPAARSVLCPECKGSGTTMVQCPYCSGKGYQGTSRNPQTCIVCKGGGKQKKACPKCSGKGTVGASE